jgi:hypothetical protein
MAGDRVGDVVLALTDGRSAGQLSRGTAARRLAIRSAHRRRRAKVRVERTLAAWPDISQAIGLPGSQVQSATVDLWG